MRLTFRFNWPLRAVGALMVLLLQYGGAWAQQSVHLPAAHPWLPAPVVHSDLGILCERDPGRPGCERLPVQHATDPAPQGAPVALQTGDLLCERDPGRPGCDSGPRQSDPRADKIAAAVLLTVLLIVGAGAASVGSAGFAMPALP